MTTWTLLFLIAFSHSPGKLVVRGLPSEEACIQMHKRMLESDKFGILSDVKTVCVKEKQ